MLGTHRIRGSFASRPLLGRLGFFIDLQGVQPLLAFVGHGLDLVDGLGDVEGGRGGGRSAILPHGRLLFDHVPPILASLFPLIGAVLVFGVFMRALIEELGVNLHEHLHGIVHHAVDSSGVQTRVRQVVEWDENSGSYLPVPMALGVLVKRSEHDREDGFHIIADEVAEVFVVPEV